MHFGQSLWLDSINRVMLRTGALARYVRDLAVTGLTSNPTILGHAMAAGSDCRRSLARLGGRRCRGGGDRCRADLRHRRARVGDQRLLMRIIRRRVR